MWVLISKLYKAEIEAAATSIKITLLWDWADGNREQFGNSINPTCEGKLALIGGVNMLSI